MNMVNLVIKYFKIGILLVTAHLPRINLKASPVKITRHNAQQIRRFYFASKGSETK